MSSSGAANAGAQSSQRATAEKRGDVRLRLCGFALALIFILGASLRLVGLNFGQPYSLHPDEKFVERDARYAYHLVERVRPPAFGAYPPALGNQIGVLARVLFVDNPKDHELRSIGRHWVWCLSCLGIVFAAGAAFLAAGRVAALVAGAMMAFSPLLVEQSRYATTDNPTASFVALVALVGFWMYRRPTVLSYLAGGVALGLAAAYKYAGAWGAAFLLLAHLASDVRWRPRYLLLLFLSGVISICIFFGLNFEILAAPSAWWHRFVFQKDYYNKTHPGYVCDHTWIHAAHYALAYGIGWSVSAASVAATLLLLWRGRLRDQGLVLGCLFVGALYLAFLANKPVFLARNLVHGLPLVFIGFAALIAAATRGIRVDRIGIGIALLALLGLSHNLFLVTKHASVLKAPDTRIRAALWLREHVTAKERVAAIGKASPLYQPPAELVGVALVPERMLALSVLQKKDYRYAVVSWGVFNRYLRNPDHEPERTKRLRSWYETFGREARSVAVFEDAMGPGGELFGATVDIYHNPRIEVFEIQRSDATVDAMDR